MESQPSTICLIEHWLPEYKNTILNKIKGYNHATSFFRTGYRGGGVSIIIRDSLTFIVREDIGKLNQKRILEVAAIEITTAPNVKPIVLVALYRPPDSRLRYLS